VEEITRRVIVVFGSEWLTECGERAQIGPDKDGIGSEDAAADQRTAALCQQILESFE
jgi:hypothetical protein